MSVRRRYDDGCAMAHALDLVGERWALLIVRELMFGPKRFTDLRAGVPGAGANVLSYRLRELEEAGVVRRRKLPPPAATWVYELTGWGQQLEPVITALGRWGGRSPSLRPDAPMSVDALMLALKTLFAPTRAVNTDLVVRMGEDAFRLRLSADGIAIERGEHDHPDAAIVTDPATLNDVIWGDLSLADAEAARGLTITGDRRRVERFLKMFPLPEPAVVP
jgi:DNA-binding HxlR family transcriptional regulator